MRKKQSEIDAAYIDRGVLSDEEVRKSRFENGYSFETTLSDNVPDNFDDDTEE